MRDGGYILDHGDCETCSLQCPQCGLASLPRSLNVDLYTAHAVFHRFFGCVFSGQLGCERCAFSGAFESHDASARPRDNVAGRIGNRDDGVIECRLNMDNTTGDIFLFFFLRTGFSWHLLHSLAVSVLLLLSRSLFLDCRTFGAFSRPGIGTGTLSMHRQPTPMSQATVAAKVHEPLNIH